MQVVDLAHLQLQIIEDVVFYGGAVAASETGEKYAFLAVIPLKGEDEVVVLASDLDLRICAGIIIAGETPTSHPQNS